MTVLKISLMVRYSPMAFFRGRANYDDPLFSFQATDLVSSGSMLISFVD